MAPWEERRLTRWRCEKFKIKKWEDSMFSMIRKRFTYANAAMTLVLVFAMSGGAYAAKHYLITSTKQISPKVLSALQGKAGRAGPQGAAGAQGSQGPAGANGKDGAPGGEGKQGPQGPAGATGPAGPEGVCSTSKCTLPKGVSETGEWRVQEVASGADIKGTGISFAVPLTSALSEAAVHFIGTNEELAGELNESPAIENGECKGSAEAPEAKSGNLCVFATQMEDIEAFPGQAIIQSAVGGSGNGADRQGAQLKLYIPSAGIVLGSGVWVVTG